MQYEGLRGGQLLAGVGKGLTAVCRTIALSLWIFFQSRASETEIDFEYEIIAVPLPFEEYKLLYTTK